MHKPNSINLTSSSEKTADIKLLRVQIGYLTPDPKFLSLHLYIYDGKTYSVILDE